MNNDHVTKFVLCSKYQSITSWLLIFHVFEVFATITTLKGKFSSGIEGALASKLNRDFNWKQISETVLCYFILMLSTFIWVTLIQKQQKYKKKKDFELWEWASHFIMILKYNR